MTKLLAAAALAVGVIAPAAPASAQICLRVICDHRPITGCYDTGEVRFCL